MRPVGGSMPNGTDDLFTVTESLQLFADDIGVARTTVEDWRWTANRWLANKRKEGVSFTVHRILASVSDDAERWAAIEDPPFNPRTGARQWTPDGAKRLVGQRVERPVTLDEKVQAVADLTRDDEVAAQVAADLFKRPEVTEHVTPADRMRVVTELTRDDTVAQHVTTDLLRRPAVARTVMRDDTARMLVNRAQFDNSAQTRERIRETTLPYDAIIERTADGIPYLVPELVLLFKAKATRPKDQADFEGVLPLLDPPRRNHLRGWLELIHPGHPWLAELAGRVLQYNLIA
ncbi:hypothetical protein GCM10010121_097590 [Streptomyces brasiliensis]|uniref:Uncharacterized protein n=2 Tax=Streptomyces brasiliensis TaxID=1954 RepID=A0A917PD75_9ACTN|nr:hypothetical protein GCM10010121_097590 [Streptomyces brasiliensis]